MKIMVISPHPDDETLGAGGSLLKLKDLGNEIYWLNITDANAGGYDRTFLEKRKIQIDRIRKYFGFSDFINLKFPPTELNDNIKGNLIKAVVCIVKMILLCGRQWIGFKSVSCFHSFLLLWNYMISSKNSFNACSYFSVSL